MVTKYHFLSDKSGVSYVEIILTVAIIGVVTSIVVANYNGGQQKQKVIYAAQQVAHDIREMQASSLAGKKASVAAARPCGYGAEFKISSPASYNLFSESSATGCDNEYDAGEELPPGPIYLPQNITIQSVSGGSQSIFYTIPFSKVYSNGTALSGQVTIQIGNSSGFTRNITINENGEVSVN